MTDPQSKVEEIEAEKLDELVACLGDDAAIVRQSSMPPEIAETMEEAAATLEKVRNAWPALREALKDAERMDWLERTNSLVNTADYGPHVCHGERDYLDDDAHFAGKNYRDAIDQAMQSLPPAPKDDGNG